MDIKLFTLASALHSETCADASKERFITGIESALGTRFDFRDSDFSGYSGDALNLIYIRTGGTEGIFRSLGLKGRILLLASGTSNSLAASMEILSYLQQKGQDGEILHGSPEYIAGRIRSICEGAASEDARQEVLPRFIRPLPAIDLGGMRLGVIGRPSDWLISSDVDYAKAARKMNAELLDIPMEELIAECGGPVSSADEERLKQMRSFEGSETVWNALRRIIERHRLGGLTLRCFDLLDTVHNTGCLALARLNAAGIPSSCEGDIPALLTMAWLQKERGCPGFQCNLSRIEGDELLFAHCTVPLSMAESYSYDTHFESGIGTAIRAQMPAGAVEIVKIAPDLESCVRIPAGIVRNCREPKLCRTQVLVNAPDAARYFLEHPLANHHVLSYV